MRSSASFPFARSNGWLFEALRFVPVGGLAVLLDLACYLGLLWIGIEATVAKSIGFVAGACFAFVGGRKFVFRRQQNGYLGVTKFAIVYGNALVLNVVANDFFLGSFEGLEYSVILLGFIIATGVSAVFNFLGMKLIVFVGDEL